MTELCDVLMMLENAADPARLAGMQRYGMDTEQRFGVSVPDLRKLARGIGTDHQLALEAWETGISDARILASMIADPALTSTAMMDAWVAGFNSWDVCDQVCDNLFRRTSHAWDKVHEWSNRQAEFEKRAAFALLACLAWHDKNAGDEQFIQALSLIEVGSTDPRNYVKKAVSWALRNIGKRNPNLHKIAANFAEGMLKMEDNTTRWIARDAIKDLSSEATQRRMAKMGG